MRKHDQSHACTRTSLLLTTEVEVRQLRSQPGTLVFEGLRAPLVVKCSVAL